MVKIVRTKLPIGAILEIEHLEDGSYEVVQEVFELVEDELDDILILIEAEELSVEDEFLQITSYYEQIRRTRQLIIEAINSGVKNFYRPIMDPSITRDRKNIFFKAGSLPADSALSYIQWVELAKKVSPSRNSRLGTRLEYGAFLGVLIKKLVEEGMGIYEAWNTVCIEPKKLGHYRNSENAKDDLELTGSRCVCGFYDLSNTSKILSDDVRNDIFWVTGGDYRFYSRSSPFSFLDYRTDRSLGTGGVGWIVLEK